MKHMVFKEIFMIAAIVGIVMAGFPKKYQRTRAIGVPLGMIGLLCAVYFE